jgi:hypothetical protein
MSRKLEGGAFSKGLLARDPDGHVMALRER